MSRPDGMSGLSYRMTMALSRDMFASNSWRCEAEAASGPTASARLLRLPVLAGFAVGGYSACRDMLKATIAFYGYFQSEVAHSPCTICRKLATFRTPPYWKASYLFFHILLSL